MSNLIRVAVSSPVEAATALARLRSIWEAGDAALIIPHGDPEETLPSDARRALAGHLRLPDSAALIVPTSGTSASPRSVVLSRHALEASALASTERLGCQQGERWVSALPLHHIAGLQVIMRSAALGTDPVIVDDPGDPRRIEATVGQAEHIALVPTQLSRCLDADVQLNRFSTVLVGGGPTASDLVQRAEAAGVRLVLSYGMTETAGGCVYDGVPLTGVDVVLERDGRIRLRGPMLALGYLEEDPEGAFTEDGWFRTSDVGTLTRCADGASLLTVQGRRDDVIMTGGRKVWPAEVAAAILRSADVSDALIVGVPDPEWGERVRAVVVTADEQRSSAEELLAEIRTLVRSASPAWCLPCELVIVEVLPRNHMGKVSRITRDALVEQVPDATIG